MLLLATAIYDFRVTEEVFWRLTPAKYAALSRRFEQHQELDDFRMAYIISTIVNVNRRKGKKAYKPQDFMPSHQQKMKGPKSTQQLHGVWRGLVSSKIDPKRDTVAKKEEGDFGLNG